MPLLMKFLGCAVLFGWIASFALSVAALPLLNRIPIWRIRAVARRAGKEHFRRLFEEAQAAPPGTPQSPELAAVREQIQAAACAAGLTMHRMVVGLKVTGWVLGAAVSWLVFFYA